MIPNDLQSSLKCRMERIFALDVFKIPPSEENDVLAVSENEPTTGPINVFEQHLPINQEVFPHILVQLLDGEQSTETSKHTANVLFVIGIYDNDLENKGHKIVTDIMNRIFEDFKANPTENSEYEINFPLRWANHEEDTFPYYFGAIETNWNVPTFKREDVEALI